MKTEAQPAWTTGKLLARNALLVAAIIEGAKAASSPPLSWYFLWYVCLSMCLLAAHDLITPNDQDQPRPTAI